MEIDDLHSSPSAYRRALHDEADQLLLAKPSFANFSATSLLMFCLLAHALLQMLLQVDCFGSGISGLQADLLFCGQLSFLLWGVEATYRRRQLGYLGTSTVTDLVGLCKVAFELGCRAVIALVLQRFVDIASHSSFVAGLHAYNWPWVAMMSMAPNPDLEVGHPASSLSMRHLVQLSCYLIACRLTGVEFFRRRARMDVFSTDLLMGYFLIKNMEALDLSSLSADLQTVSLLHMDQRHSNLAIVHLRILLILTVIVFRFLVKYHYHKLEAKDVSAVPKDWTAPTNVIVLTTLKHEFGVAQQQDLTVPVVVYEPSDLCLRLLTLDTVKRSLFSFMMFGPTIAKENLKPFHFATQIFLVNELTTAAILALAAMVNDVHNARRIRRLKLLAIKLAEQKLVATIRSSRTKIGLVSSTAADGTELERQLHKSEQVNQFLRQKVEQLLQERSHARPSAVSTTVHEDQAAVLRAKILQMKIVQERAKQQREEQEREAKLREMQEYVRIAKLKQQQEEESYRLERANLERAIEDLRGNADREQQLKEIEEALERAQIKKDPHVEWDKPETFKKVRGRLFQLSLANADAPIVKRHISTQMAWPFKWFEELLVRPSPFGQGTFRQTFFARPVPLPASTAKPSAAAAGEPPKTCSKYVVKTLLQFSKENLVKTENDMLLQCKSHLLAQSFVNDFNRDRAKFTDHPTANMDLRFVNVHLFLADDGSVYAKEDLIEGEFMKWNSNGGAVDSDDPLPQTFSHYTYVKTKKQHMVVDLQGVCVKDPTTAKVTYLLTDPAVHSHNGGYGETDQAARGFALFFKSHQCNDLCMLMKLDK